MCHCLPQSCSPSPPVPVPATARMTLPSLWAPTRPWACLAPVLTLSLLRTIPAGQRECRHISTDPCACAGMVDCRASARAAGSLLQLQLPQMRPCHPWGFCVRYQFHCFKACALRAKLKRPTPCLVAQRPLILTMADAKLATPIVTTMEVEKETQNGMCMLMGWRVRAGGPLVSWRDAARWPRACAVTALFVQTTAQVDVVTIPRTQQPMPDTTNLHGPMPVTRAHAPRSCPLFPSCGSRGGRQGEGAVALLQDHP
jgi:hypothetical protein